MTKLWIDDVRPAPKGYLWLRSTNEAIDYISSMRLFHRISGGKKVYEIDLIDIDHDAGSFSEKGGDYIKVLDWMEANNVAIPIHIHSMNPVGVQNMRAIIQRNGWQEV